MTLAQIVERLERIEMLRFTANISDIVRAVEELKNDIEMALIKAGQL